MLNSTKTWQEELRDIKDHIGQYFISYLGQNEIKALEKFISDLRKRDMEALIEMIDSTHTIREIREALIDYYTN